MSKTTQWISMRVDDFFQESDNEMEQTFREKNLERLMCFIVDYVEQFPTPARYIYEKIYEKDKALHDCYTDYTLSALKPDAEASSWVEKCREEYKQKAAEYPQKLEAYNRQKEVYERDPEAHPNKPKKPNKIWPFYIGFYNNQIIAKALKEKQIELRSDWKEIIAEQGFLFSQNTKKANTVRSMMFDLAFALDWDEEILRNMLRKLLLQADFNPKNPTEAVYWYCLANRIPHHEMCSDYLAYIESPEFKEKYAYGFAPNSGRRQNTVDLETRLKEIIKKDRDDLFSYLWFLKYTNVGVSRKTPAEIYWENFRCFPKTVWTGNRPGTQNLITEEDLRALELLETGTFAEGTRVRSLEEIIKEVIRLNPEKSRRGSDDKQIDYLFKTKKPVQKDQEDSDTQKAFLYSEEEYQKILSLILEKSRKNYFASNTEALIGSDLLKQIFGDLDYTHFKVENRKNGKAFLSRADVVATKFISFFSDLFALYPDLNQKKRDRLSLFRELVNDDLKECGLYKFYPRSPFELFIILCFWQQDPLAYFMASWEASRRA